MKFQCTSNVDLIFHAIDLNPAFEISNQSSKGMVSRMQISRIFCTHFEPVWLAAEYPNKLHSFFIVILHQFPLTSIFLMLAAILAHQHYWNKKYGRKFMFCPFLLNAITYVHGFIDDHDIQHLLIASNRDYQCYESESEDHVYEKDVDEES